MYDKIAATLDRMDSILDKFLVVSQAQQSDIETLTEQSLCDNIRINALARRVASLECRLTNSAAPPSNSEAPTSNPSGQAPSTETA